MKVRTDKARKQRVQHLLAVNAGKVAPRAGKSSHRDILRKDPTRLTSLRKQFIGYLNKQFAVLKGRLVNLILVEDALGLRSRSITPPMVVPTGNFDPEQERDEHGRFSAGTPEGMGAVEREVWHAAVKNIPTHVLEMAGVREFHIGRPEGQGPDTGGFAQGKSVWVDGSNPRTALHEISHHVEFALHNDERSNKEMFSLRKDMIADDSMKNDPREKLTIFIEAMYSDKDSRAYRWATQNYPEYASRFNKIERTVTGGSKPTANTSPTVVIHHYAPMGPEMGWEPYMVGNFNPDQDRDEQGRFVSTGGKHQIASDEVQRLTRTYGEAQGSESGISPREICEGFCSWFAHGVVRAIQQKLGRKVGVAGHANETDDVYTSRTNMDASGEGHMWVTVAGKHFDPEAPKGVDDPKDLPWLQRHPGFKVLGRASHVANVFCKGASPPDPSCPGKKQAGFSLVPGVKSVKRAPDHKLTGTYHVTLDNGDVHSIYYDKQSSLWMHASPKVSGPSAPWIATSKGDVLTRLVERQHDFVANVTDASGHEHDAEGKFTSGGGGGVAQSTKVVAITKSEARGDSREVSLDEYNRIADEGKNILDRMKRDSSPCDGLDSRWATIKIEAYIKAQESWGGMTIKSHIQPPLAIIDSHTGKAVEEGEDKYALTVKEQGQQTVSVHEGATFKEFSDAMDEARRRFGSTLEHADHHLGVFHDDANHRIDIDPGVIVGSKREVEAIGAFTRAIGGAYCFKDGNGYWPPHVADGVHNWRQRTFPVFLQGTNYTCGVAALAAILAYHGHTLTSGDLWQLRRDLKTTYHAGTDWQAISKFTPRLGLRCDKLDGMSLDMAEPRLPVMAGVLTDDLVEHWVVLWGIGDNSVQVMDPLEGNVTWSKSKWHQWSQKFGLAIGDVTDNYEGQPRDRRGRFASASTEARMLIARMYKGGATYEPLASSTPKEGVVVSLDRSKGYEEPIPIEEFNKHPIKIVREYVEKLRQDKKAGLLGKDVHYGGWYDEEKREMVLDANQVYEDREHAVRVGTRREQYAIFDLGKKELIRLKGPTDNEQARLQDHGRRDRRGTGSDRGVPGGATAEGRGGRGTPGLNYSPDQPRDDRGRFGQGSSTVKVYGATSEQFHDLADQQRDKPEHAMLRVQFAYGGGILNPVVEHTGDLIHRMAERPTFASAGYEFVKPKVEQLLGYMDKPHDWKPGGSFGDEVQHSIQSNRDYYEKEDAGKAMAYHTDVKDALEKYAVAHKELKPLNEAQRQANQAAIAVGEMRWGDAIGHLKALKEHLGSREDWIKYAHEGLVTANYSPDQPRDDRGRFGQSSSTVKVDQTQSKEFKAWFKDSKVVDADGKPLVMFHGTRSDFNQFQTDPDTAKSFGVFDKMLGAHFAEDSSVTSAFTIGEYARAHDHAIDYYNPENSWFRDTKGLHYGEGIPTLVKGNGEQEPWDIDKHGSVYTIRERFGEGSTVVMVQPGGHTMPVYLNIKNPLVIEAGERESDQSAIPRKVMNTVFPQDRQLFVDAYAHGRGADKEQAGQIWDTLKAGKTWDGGKYDTYKSFSDISDNYSTLLGKPDFVLRAKAVLKDLGHDGVKYRNTSGNEVKGKANPWAWIAFEPTQIKSAIGNKGTFDPKDPIITHTSTLNYSPDQPRDHGKFASTEDTEDYDPSSSDAGERAHTPKKDGQWFTDPPDGYVRIYRGVNPERNVIAGKDLTHGLWYTSSHDEAVSYANWDYDGGGELGPGRAVLAVDVPFDDAVDYGKNGSRRKFDPDEIRDESGSGIEMLLDREVTRKATLYEGNAAEAERGRPLANYSPDQPRDHGKFASTKGDETTQSKGVIGRIKSLTDKIPAPLKKLAQLPYTIAIAANKTVQAVAREKGMSEDKVTKLSYVVGLLDMHPGAGGRNASLALLAGLGVKAAGPAFYTPLGSIAYLAYSVVTSPLAVLRAAKNAILKTVQKFRDMLKHEGSSTIKTRVRNVFNPDQLRDADGRWIASDVEVSVSLKDLTIDSVIDTAKDRYRKAGVTVDGRKVLPNIDNQGSIASSLTNYEVLPGIREVRLGEFRSKGDAGPRSSADDERKVSRLVERMKADKKVSPLIVVDDGHPDGPYVLEGGHRFDALHRMGVNSFPAKVVLDLDSIASRVRAGKLTSRLHAPTANVSHADVRLLADAMEQGDWHMALLGAGLDLGLNVADAHRLATMTRRGQYVANFDPDQQRDDHGRWTGGDAQTQTPEFKAWFGKSKVVDDEGRPLRVFHGTGANVKVFDVKHLGTATDFGFAGAGHYFMDDPEWGSAYAETSLSKGGSPNVVPAYLSLQNPKIIYDFKELPESKREQDNWMKSRPEGHQKKVAFEIRDRLVSEGYDGVIVKGTGGNPSEFVAFHPTQIKSASANRGTWDSRDPNILNYNPDQPRDHGRFASTEGAPALTPTPGLTDRQAAVEAKWIAQYHADPDAMVSRYLRQCGPDNPEHPGTYVINMDDARELCPEYAASREGRTEFTPATNRVASAVATAAYEHAVRAPVAEGHSPVVVFTSGGPGSGKTSGLGSSKSLSDTVKNAHVLFDSSQAQPEMIQGALDRGLKVHVIFTYRDAEDSYVNGVLPRAMEMGRPVNARATASLHIKAVNTLEQDQAQFKDNPNVAFSIIDNSRGRGKAAVVSTLPAGVTRDEPALRERLKQATEEAYRAGKIDAPLHRASLELERTGQGAGTANRREAQRVRAGWQEVSNFNPDQIRDSHGRWADQTDSPAFKEWFKDSKVVDEDGKPLVVLHGTTHIIEAFKDAGSPGMNPEGDWGAGNYFTSSNKDLDNYAGIGADLTNRIESRADEIDTEENRSSRADHRKSVEEARKELVGRAEAVGMPVYLSMQNPFVLGDAEHSEHPVKETYFTSEFEYADKGDPESDIVGEKGTLHTLLSELRRESRNYPDAGGVHDFIDKVLDHSSGEGMSASQFDKMYRHDSGMASVTDEDGKMAYMELYRKALERAGYDGVIDRTVGTKFKHMPHMHEGTVHYIAFKGTQVKSASGNRGTFDPSATLVNRRLAANTRWAFHQSARKLAAFQDWLKQQLNQTLTGLSTRQVVEDYIHKGFKQGAGRAFDDVRAKRKAVLASDKMPEYAAGKDEFLRSSFAQPTTVEKVELLASRSFDELANVTTDLSNKCLVGDTVVNAAVVRAVFRRWYVGDVLEIETRNGSKFTTTPNHPMLTREGWKTTSMLKNGDYLVRSSRQQHLGDRGDHDIQGVPSTISEIFDSVSTVGILERAKTTEPDFHGDGMDGEVEILSLDRALRVGNFTPLNEHLTERVFTSPSVGFGRSSRFCSVCGYLLPIDESICFICGSDCHSGLFQPISDRGKIGVKRSANGIDGFTCQVSGNKFVGVNVSAEVVGNSAMLPSEGLGLGVCTADSCSADHETDPSGISTFHLSNLSSIETGQVELDEVISVRSLRFSGHVFNLETEHGYYNIAGGYYTGNCSRVLTDALVEGKNPRDVMTELSDVLGSSRYRAETIAITELARTHVEGSLMAMEKLGVTQLGVEVEWVVSGLGTTAAGWPSPCETCAAMAGSIYSIEDAHGLIPAHPRCLCSFVPVVDMPSSKKSPRITRNTRPTCNHAHSRRLYPWPAGIVLNDARRYLVNADDANCGTGAGGFQPGNTCAKGGGDGQGGRQGESGAAVSEGAGTAPGSGQSAGGDTAAGGVSTIRPLTDKWITERTSRGEFTEGFAGGLRRALRNAPEAVQDWFEQGRPNNWPVLIERDTEEAGLPGYVKEALSVAQAITVNGFRIEYAKDPSGMGGKINTENLVHELTHTAYRELTRRAPELIKEAEDEATQVGDKILQMAFKKVWATKNPPNNDQDYDTWQQLRDVRRYAASIKRYVKSGQMDVTGSLELSLAIPAFHIRDLGKYGGKNTTEAGDQWHVVAIYNALCKKYGTTIDPVYRGEELVTYKAGKHMDYAQRLFSRLLDKKPTGNRRRDTLNYLAQMDPDYFAESIR